MFVYVFGFICLICIVAEAFLNMGLRKVVVFVVMCVVAQIMLKIIYVIKERHDNDAG